jgi:hypothetical protein
VNNKLCFGLHCSLLGKDLLKLMTVDVLRLFIQFGHQLCDESFALEDNVFAPLSLSGDKGSPPQQPFLSRPPCSLGSAPSVHKTSSGLRPNPHASALLPNRICDNFATVQHPDFHCGQTAQEDGS